MQPHNPYTGVDFFGFFLMLAQRIWGFATGALSSRDVASDEIQIVVIAGVALSCSLVGTFLVLRKMTMLANALSHTILLGIVLAFLMMQMVGGGEGHHVDISIQVMVVAAIVTGLLTAFLTEFLTKSMRLQEDASTGLVFTTLFAIGVVLVTVLTKNVHIGTEVVMGNADGLRFEDSFLVYAIAVGNVVIFGLLFRQYQLTTFDGALAKALGFSPILFNYVLMSQASVTAIGAFRAVGVLMVLAFFTGPPLTARMLSHSLQSLLWIASGLGVLASLVGVALARHFLSVEGISFSTSGMVVCVLIVQFALVAGYRTLRK